VIRLAPGQPRHRLLVAEDQPENRLLLRRMLDPVGFEIREAQDGREAVEVFDAWSPHLILMDIRMPVMDSKEATRRIRGATAGRVVKIVAVTAQAHVMEAERGEVLAAGCDALIRKPIREVEIFAALGQLLDVVFLYAEEGPREADFPDPTADRPPAPADAADRSAAERRRATGHPVVPRGDCRDRGRRSWGRGRLAPVREGNALSGAAGDPR
jgi:CheY-like chemotaxis protein